MNGWLSDIANYQVLGTPLLVIGICGLVGVFIDLDHLAAYLQGWNNARFAHTPIFIIGSIMLCGIIACIAGLYIRMVLKNG